MSTKYSAKFGFYSKLIMACLGFSKILLYKLSRMIMNAEFWLSAHPVSLNYCGHPLIHLQVDRRLEMNCGVVKSKRSLWRLSTIVHFFWITIDFICAFFGTMFSMEKTDAYKKSSGYSKKWDGGPGGGGGGGDGRGPYGGRGSRDLQGMADLRSNDHSAFPACGSCCGG